MRALVNNNKLTKFMQCLDVFEKGKFIYSDLNLIYEVNDKIIHNERSILKLAKLEFGDDLILLFGKDKPLYINPNVQSISNGKTWGTLLNVLKQVYPNLEFEHDQRLMNIKIKEDADNST